MTQEVAILTPAQRDQQQCRQHGRGRCREVYRRCSSKAHASARSARGRVERGRFVRASRWDAQKLSRRRHPDSRIAIDRHPCTDEDWRSAQYFGVTVDDLVKLHHDDRSASWFTISRRRPGQKLIGLPPGSAGAPSTTSLWDALSEPDDGSVLPPRVTDQDLGSRSPDAHVVAQWILRYNALDDNRSRVGCRSHGLDPPSRRDPCRRCGRLFEAHRR
jgi:hypothetical protein